MAQITFHDEACSTSGALPAVGTQAPAFTLVGKELADVSLADFAGKKVVLNIFPSIDTPVCAASVRKFNVEAASLSDTVVLCISQDLPFAQWRFCGAEGVDRVLTCSAFRAPEFGKNYGVTLVDGPIRGLLCRAVVVVTPAGRVAYTQLVPEITQEPDYAEVLRALEA